MQDVWITHAVLGAKCSLADPSSSYVLLPHSHQHPKIIRQPFNMARLRHPYHYNRFWETLDDKLKDSAPHTEDNSEKWCQFKKIITETTKLSWVLKIQTSGIVSMRNKGMYHSAATWGRTRPHWSGKMTQAPTPRQTNLAISEDKPRRDC